MNYIRRDLNLTEGEDIVGFVKLQRHDKKNHELETSRGETKR
jgi:hypothetical protein